jgi:hypothetical protein
MISPSGVVTSIKSIDLTAGVYQNDARLMYRLSDYVGRVSDFDGDQLGDDVVAADQIKGRVLQVVIPKGSITDAQQNAIDAVREWGKELNNPVDLVITEF